MIAKDLKTWSDVFPPEHGIFEVIQSEYDWELPEWVGISPIELDQMAWGQFGWRHISIMVYKYFERYTATDAKRDLARAVWGLYHKKWEKMIALAELEYDPIHNFLDKLHEEIEGTEDETTADNDVKSVLKVETRALTVSRLDHLTSSRLNTGTQNNLRTDNLAEAGGYTTGVSNQDSHSQNVYGFNSTNPVGYDTDGGSSSTNTVNDNHRTNTGTQSNARTDNLNESRNSRDEFSELQGGNISTTDDITDDRDVVRDLDTTRVRDMTRTGNIGNLSTQNLIQQEIELWRWKFIQEILDDVKDFGTLPIYC